MVDQEKVEAAIRLLLESIGEDPTREGLLETPARVARMYSEIAGGMDQSAEEHLSKTFAVASNDLVIERDITFYSLCEHHLLPFYGKAAIGYIPNGRVAGLSKLARTVEGYARIVFCKGLCPSSAAAGAAVCTGCRRPHGISCPPRSDCADGSRAYVHDHARRAKARYQDRNACSSRCL